MGTGDTGRIRVLHVDDEQSVVDIVSTFLEREGEGFAVKTATSPGKALDRVDDVDCIISDYEMPETNGIEFLETVRETNPDVPFILYTGTGSESVAGEAITAGATDYVQKGSGTDQYADLANRIEQAITGGE
jgi:CheY-like chemotaxis protein